MGIIVIFAAEKTITSNKKNMRQPEPLSIQRMFDTLTAQNIIPPKHFYLDSFGVVIGMSRFLQPFIGPSSGPYLLEDYRIGVITKGSMHGFINLKEYHACEGMVIFVAPGTIVEPLGMSDDFCIAGMGVPTDMMQMATAGSITCVMGGVLKHGVLSVSTDDQRLLEHMFHTLWEIATMESRNNDAECTFVPVATRHMVGAIVAYYDRIFSGQQAMPAGHSTSATTIFDRFLQLVNSHCREQRSLGYYADRLCLTDRYLGTVVRQSSGITAKEWIDRAVIAQAKVMLRHSDRQITEITDELHFASPSFFCKYFRRLTGVTPQQYRLQQ